MTEMEPFDNIDYRTIDWFKYMRGNLRKEATRLRRKGFSYRQIQSILRIPKSTINNWFKDQPWSAKIKLKLIKQTRPIWQRHCQKLGLARRAHWQKVSKAARKEAQRLYPKYSKEPLFMAGLMLYWGEGDNKNSSMVRISNTKPAILKTFRLFLLKYCGLKDNRIKLSLILYPDLQDKACRVYWARQVGISLDQFIKTQYIKGKHPTNRLAYGVAIIYLSSRELKEKILEWIRLTSVRLAGIV